MRTSVDLHHLIEAAGDAMIVSDANGAIVLWNPAAERMFGWSEDEALGESLDLITPERLRHRHWEGYHKTMATGITKYGTDLLRVPAMHKDGRPMSIAFTVAMLFDGDRPHAILAVIRDETVRFAEERELKKRVTELESRLATSGATP